MVDAPTRPGSADGASGGPVMGDKPPVPGEPLLRWSSRAHSIDEIDKELARIWSAPKLTTVVEGVEERHIAARTSVMNLVVVARRPEIGEHCAAVIQQLTGRHPSRTLILTSGDPESRSWLDAQIRASSLSSSSMEWAREDQRRSGSPGTSGLSRITGPPLAPFPVPGLVGASTIERQIRLHRRPSIAKRESASSGPHVPAG